MQSVSRSLSRAHGSEENPNPTPINWFIIPQLESSKALAKIRRTQPTHVHFSGHPYVWLVKKVLKVSPGIKQIRLTPTRYAHMIPSISEICAAAGVEVVTGTIFPGTVWRRGRIYNETRYGRVVKFFQNLDLHQQELWLEFLATKHRFALVAARYICMNGEEYMSLRDVAGLMGYGASSWCHGSSVLRSVMKYLDPNIKASHAATERARIIAVRMSKLREKKKREQAEAAALQTFNLQQFPTALPARFQERYLKLLMLHRSGKLEPGPDEKRRKLHIKAVNLVALRYGVFTGRFLTFREIAQMLGVTRQYCEQIEKIALTYLKV